MPRTIVLSLLALLTLTACASEPSAPDPATAEASAPVTNSCNPRNYPCDPMEPSANRVCEWICGDGEAGAGYCMPYTAVEDVWCAAHPGRLFGPLKYCDSGGNPTWATHCAPGWMP
jgi:hypothetical protein